VKLGKSVVVAMAAVALVASSALAADMSDLRNEALDHFAPLPSTPVFKEGNRPNDAKITLGRMLFFDARLSKSNVFSCNSCHNLGTGGVDNNSFSTGHRWQVGGRNAPTVFNASLHIAQFWDGRAADVEAQAVGPELNPVEMGATEALIMERLASIPAYVKLFSDAFPEQRKPLRYENVGAAIGAFERTLLTPSAFDAYLNGNESALSGKEKKGLAAFMNVGCVNCHNGVAVGGNSYQVFGAVNQPENLADKGRFDVTGKEEDLHVFKVPSLRNIELTYPYFNDGSVWELEKAVKIMGWTQLGEKLSDKQIDEIVAFLGSLTGVAESYDLPTLPPSTAKTPRPDRN
jgi:cytochrome c peroxidase